MYRGTNGDEYMMSTHRDNAWDARNSYDAYAMHSPVSNTAHSYTPTSTHTPPQQYAQYDNDAYNYNGYNGGAYGNGYSAAYNDSPHSKDSYYNKPLPNGARDY